MRSETKAPRLLSMLALLVALGGCMADTKYLSFASVEREGWEYDDTLTYIIPPLAGTRDGGVSLLLHTEGYGYENIAFDIVIRQDTLLLYREQRTYWLKEHPATDGIGRRYDYALPIGNIELCDTLPTTITLLHQIDQPILTGIREIGIRMSKPLRQAGEPVWRVDWR